MHLSSRAHIWILVLALTIALAACGGEPDPALESQAAAKPSASAEVAADTAQRTRLNLNSATREAFLTIPNVGDRMVREFFEYRPYVSIRQFRREIGKYVDEEQVAAYEQYVYVPVDPNESDAETLQQLPGVDATEAEELTAGRPYASKDAFLEKLGTYVTSDERSVGETYLKTQ